MRPEPERDRGDLAFRAKEAYIFVGLLVFFVRGLIAMLVLGAVTTATGTNTPEPAIGKIYPFLASAHRSGPYRTSYVTHGYALGYQICETLFFAVLAMIVGYAILLRVRQAWGR